MDRPGCAVANQSLVRSYDEHPAGEALGNYIVPKLDVQLAFTFRSDRGAPLSANYVASNGETTLVVRSRVRVRRSR
jgi:hypothetical protein